MKDDYSKFYADDSPYGEGWKKAQARKCHICRIREREEPLIQFGDYVYLCTICNTNKAKNRNWSFNDAWRERYAQKYRKANLNHTCGYCGGKDIITDIFGKDHPNPVKPYWGILECEYCEYDRKIATPRHRALMQVTAAHCVISYHL